MRRSIARKNSLDPVNQNPSTMNSVKPLNFLQNTSYRYNSFSKNSKSNTKSHVVIISALSVVFSFLIYLIFLSFGRKIPHNSRRFSIVIDGGSTGSRIHIFEYKVEDGVPKFDFGPHGLGSMRVNPGLSAYAGDPGSAGGSLVELLEFGKSRVPSEFWGETEIRLMATAGLRLLDVKVQDRIMGSCRRVLRSSGFKFHDEWASVITGSDEGLYAWVIANYALGSLGANPQQTTGIIELGGASAQVAFACSGPLPLEFSRSLKYANITYNLYSNSWLHFGQNVAFDSMKEFLVSNSRNKAEGSVEKELLFDPCTPKGYSHYDMSNLSHGSLSQKAAGNFSECRAAALMMLYGRKDECPSRQCSLKPDLMPRLHGNFLATENFFYTWKFFGLERKAALSDLVLAGQRYCEDDWSSIKSRYSSLEKEDLLRYCFSSAYIVALLHDGLGIGLDEARIMYTNHVDGTPLDWALGAFILHATASVDVREEPEWIAGLFHDGLSNLFLVFVASMILMFVGWSISNWKRPCLKTIYDLEKGRYIVTRISR